jgi:hypothetical protein
MLSITNIARIQLLANTFKKTSMSHFDDAKHLIEHCKPTLEKIKKYYSESLHDKTIKPTMLIEIKNFMENLRSALDFSANGLYDKYGDKTKKADKIYFPYAWTGLDKAGFNSKKIIEQKIPGLSTNRPDIATQIEGINHFHMRIILGFPGLWI